MRTTISPSFWQGRKVFLTGHTGFKGAWLSTWLHKLGADVTGYALAPATQPNLFDLAELDQTMHSVIGDIRDPAHLLEAMQIAQPEIVIHMAAQPLVRYSYLNPVETYSTNVMGLVNVFEAIRQTPSVKAVVNVTSDKCYENREWDWGYRENEAMGGYDPYSSSKGCAELITSAYRRSYFNPETYATHGVALASARAGNVIGGGDWSDDRLIPDIIRAFTAGQHVTIRNPHAIRPWQHVLEPLHGYLMLAERLITDGVKFAEGWNFGSNPVDAQPVSWIMARMKDKWGAGADYTIDPNAATVHEAGLLTLDSSKANKHLSWQPHWSLEQTLDMICAWHQAHIKGQNMRDMTLAQITAYEL